MNFKEAHRKRVENVKSFTGKNKLFVIIVVVLLFYIVFSVASGNKDNESSTQSSQTTTSSSEEETPTEETEKNGWRFYWIDLWILGIGGGFCVIMILQEKRKAREEL